MAVLRRNRAISSIVLIGVVVGRELDMLTSVGSALVSTIANHRHTQLAGLAQSVDVMHDVNDEYCARLARSFL